mgnify:CR=1 FL=1
MLKQKNILDEKARTRTNYELEIRKKEFLEICNLLDKLKIRYFLQGGVLLGAIRHNGFIPWDWDTELGVFANEVTQIKDLLIKEISVSNFTIKYYSKELLNFKVDFVGKLPDDVNRYTIIGWNHDKIKKIFWRKTYKIPDHFLINMKKIKLFDRYHFTHYPPEKYLEYQYGNWKKPLQTSNKYVYMRSEFSGLNYIKDKLTKILNKFIKFFVKFGKKDES